MNNNAEDLLIILASEKPSDMFWKLYEDQTLHMLLPELTDLYVEQKGHKNNFIHTLKVLDQACEVSTDVWFRLAALLHDIGKAPTRKFIDGEWTFRLHEEIGARMLVDIWRRFDFPDEKFARIELITRYHGLAKELCKPNISDSAIRRFFKDTKTFFDDLILFCKCDITTRFIEKKNKYRDDLEILKNKAYEIEKIDIAASYRIPIDGIWLMEQTGLKAGKWIKDIKDYVEKAIKEGVIADAEQPSKELALKLMVELGYIS